MTTDKKSTQTDEEKASEREALEKAKEAGDLTAEEEARLTELTESDDDDSSSKEVVK